MEGGPSAFHEEGYRVDGLVFKILRHKGTEHKFVAEEFVLFVPPGYFELPLVKLARERSVIESQLNKRRDWPYVR